MSAFIVADACLLQVCEAVYPFTAPDWQEPIAQALLIDLANLNIDAVNCRYAHHNDPDTHRTPQDLKFDCIYAPDVQLLKAMDCWLYQCTEGEQFTSTPLYKRVAAAAEALAAVVSRETPAYDDAQWGD